jgi:hypothetical protein
MSLSATFRIDTHKTGGNATICQPKAVSRITQNPLQICRTRQNPGCQGQKLPMAGATIYDLVRKSAANGYGMANRAHCRINCSRGGPRGMMLAEVDAQGFGFAALFERDLRAQASCTILGRFITVPENVKATRGRQSPVGPQSP